jgi:hypothetical protein
MRILGGWWRVEAKLHSIAPKFSLACIAFLSLCFVIDTGRVELKAQQETMCLAENLYHEARGELPEDKYRIGLLMLARVTDPDPQWPKTICGSAAQKRAYSWVLDYRLATDRSEQKSWEESQTIARDLIANAWTKYVLPQGWQCARFYKRTDDRGVSKNSKKYFDTALVPVGYFGVHTAYKERRGCKAPMPTS